MFRRPLHASATPICESAKEITLPSRTAEMPIV